jgi:hypothetical protein
MDDKTVAARIRAEQARTLANIAAEEAPPETAFWLSFAGEDGFHGAVIVHANDFMEAVMRTNLMGINPHGEVVGLDISPAHAKAIPAHWKNRLLNRDDCDQFEKEMSASAEEK